MLGHIPIGIGRSALDHVYRSVSENKKPRRAVRTGLKFVRKRSQDQPGSFDIH
ncbi:protein of unassigned function [Methylobacterium oryzae CBMB20]|uniref:Protein of unassigned function n=1 Tax=Methylobacterium oryzae CBMB20 TaxID=693986 RepID=A0A089NSJ0_9HYPH|nr:protein of unassigned function [Methylobacterium oryzae CBMB20]